MLGGTKVSFPDAVIAGPYLRFAACWCSGSGGNDNCKFKGGYDAARIVAASTAAASPAAEFGEAGNVVVLDP